MNRYLLHQIKLGMVVSALLFVHSLAIGNPYVEILSTVFENSSQNFIGKRFQGNWGDSRTWGGTFCNGHFSYSGNLAGMTKELDYEVSEDWVDVYANLTDVDGRFGGAYRSWVTACFPISQSVGVWINWLDIHSRVWLYKQDGKIRLKLRIKKTELGRVHFATSWLPSWMVGMFSWVTNRALAILWNSKMGDWVSDAIAKELEKQIPQP